jgi:outer membrane protein assembly factor BamA
MPTLRCPHEFAVGGAIAWLAGCASIPRGAVAVDTLTLEGTHEVSAGDLESKLVTAPSPRLLGLFRGLFFDYALYDRFVLQRDLARVERFYQARGFYQAHVRAGRVRYRDPRHVDLTIQIEEGSSVRVRNVRLDGLEHLPAEDVEAARRAARGLAKGSRFDEDDFAAAEDAIKRALTDRGYAFAKVERSAEVDLPRHGADLLFDVHPSGRCTVGPITIDGLGPLPAAPLRRALEIRRGEPYSTAAFARSQRAALGLGDFTTVEITPDLAGPPSPTGEVPIRVRVEPTKIHGLTLGGGIELDAIQTDGHLLFGWEDRNFFGGLRQLSASFRPGGVLYPTRLPSFQKPEAVLPEEKLHVELAQPGLLEARTRGVLSGELDIYPVLLTTDVEPGEPVLGYREIRGAAGVERTFGHLLVRPTYNAQLDEPFTYEGPVDPTLTRAILSYVGVQANLDYRDDQLTPHRGFYLGGELQLGGGVLGGDAHDVRIQPEARAYIALAKKLTLALRGTFGFLYPINYGSTLAAAYAGLPVTDRAAWSSDVELVYLRGFFSGGPSSNRGYPLRGVGPHGAVPFFNPGLAAQQIETDCEPDNPSYDPVRCAVPLGGLSIWESSVELRFPLSGSLSAATFCDASDVSPSRTNLRPGHPHLSCGFGLRYGTPVGPVRLDVGYRIPGLQVIGPYNAQEEGDPGTVLGLPIAVAFGIGEAF